MDEDLVESRSNITQVKHGGKDKTKRIKFTEKRRRRNVCGYECIKKLREQPLFFNIRPPSTHQPTLHQKPFPEAKASLSNAQDSHRKQHKETAKANKTNPPTTADKPKK